jgi:hypothetical protein
MYHQLPIYSCEVTSGATGKVDPDLFATKKKSGTRADLFLGDLSPNEAQMPFCEMLREFAAGYVKAHSVYRHTFSKVIVQIYLLCRGLLRKSYKEDFRGRKNCVKARSVYRPAFP